MATTDELLARNVKLLATHEIVALIELLDAELQNREADYRELDGDLDFGAQAYSEYEDLGWEDN